MAGVKRLATFEVNRFALSHLHCMNVPHKPTIQFRLHHQIYRLKTSPTILCSPWPA